MAPKHIEDYFSKRSLVASLVRRRLTEARRRRREHFISGLIAESPKHSRTEVSVILPPRKHWLHFRPNAAQRRSNPGDTPTLLARRMTDYVLLELERPVPKYRWADRLGSFLQTVKEAALAWEPSHEFTHESVYAFPKGQPGNDRKYRIVTVYGLKDSLIAAGFGSLLRDLIDGSLSEHCLAFRPALGNGKPPPSHHDAISKIQEFARPILQDSPIWCAECDIQGFFDSVSHAVAKARVATLLRFSRRSVDPRLQAFLVSFFAGYDYRNVAVPEARRYLTKRKEKVTKPLFADPVKALIGCGLALPDGGIGIPQGSFMSCVLANVVLQAADASCLDVLESSAGNDGLYLRYCDDILIGHLSRERSNNAIETYIDALKQLHLPFHPLQKVAAYGSAFWQSKSKAPYAWCDDCVKPSVPWLGFVGYQVHRDGTVRVRKQSIDRELAKQRQIVDDYIASVDRKVNRSSKPPVITPLKNTSYRLLMHLVAIGVGYPASHTTFPSKHGVSWTRGFRALDQKKYDDSGLRRLDRGRMKAISRLRFRLNRLIERGVVQLPKEKPDKIRPKFQVKFGGPPFSYARQFRNN